MALYASGKYGALKYGNASYITSTTAGFKAAQAALVRKLYSALKIVSHFLQFGRAVSYPSTIYIGGSNHRRAAQKFICPISFTCTAVQLMMKGASGNTGDIVVEIQTDNAGAPSGTAVANASRADVSAVVNGTQKWYQVDFKAGASLVAGTTYWLVARDDGATTNITYLAADDKGGNDEPSFYTSELGIYGTFKYGAQKYGTSWADDWAATGYVLCARLISSAEVQNEQLVNEMVSWDLTRSRDLPCYEFSAGLINKDYRYSLGQIYSDWLDAGKKLKCYLGLEVSGVPVHYRVFIGETDQSPAEGDTLQLQARCLMKRLLDLSQTHSDLGATAYETIIQTIAADAGITAYDLRVTGKNSQAGLTLEDMTAFAAADKVREATIDRLQFYNAETIKTTARAKASASEASVPIYELSDDDFIISAQVGQDNDGLITRCTATNDEDGALTSDGNPLETDFYQSLGTAAGNCAAGAKTKDVTIAFVDKPVMYLQVSDAESDCEITAIDIDCGTSAVAGSITITLRNKNYPSAQGDYDLSVSGCPVLNASANVHIGETINPQSWRTYGKFSQRIDNKIIGSKADAEALADAVIAEKGTPIERVSAEARGVVDIYPDDIVRLVEARKTKLNHLVIITASELHYQKDPASFTMKLAGEKLNFVGA